MRRISLVILALHALMAVDRSEAAERFCAGILSAATGTASPARAVGVAWDELFREGVDSARGGALRTWALAGRPPSIRRAASDWLSPPEELLSPPVREGFELLREIARQVEGSTVDVSVFHAELELAILDFVAAEADRMSVEDDAVHVRLARAYRPKGVREFALGMPTVLAEVEELADGRIAASGYASHPLAILDRADALLRDVDLGPLPATNHARPDVSPLKNGGYTISTFNNRFGIFSPVGVLLKEVDGIRGMSLGTHPRAVEAADGTIAYLSATKELILVHPGADWRVDRVSLEYSSRVWNPIALRDGNIGVPDPLRFRIFDTSGVLRGDAGAGWISNPPIELSDGAVAIPFHTRLGGTFKILRLGGSSPLMIEEFQADFERAIDGARMVETTGGRVVFPCVKDEKKGLLFVNRVARSSRFVPIELVVGGNPVELPSGGVAAQTRTELRVFDDEGEWLNQEEDKLLGGQYYIGSPVVFRLAGSNPGAWGIASMTQNAIVATNAAGALRYRQEFFAPPATAETSFIQLRALLDGALLALDTRGNGWIFQLETAGNGK